MSSKDKILAIRNTGPWGQKADNSELGLLPHQVGFLNQVSLTPLLYAVLKIYF